MVEVVVVVVMGEVGCRGGAETVAFRNHFGLVFVTGTMVRGCPDFSVLFSTHHTEDNRLESFAHADLSPGVLAFVSGHAVKGTGFDQNRMLQ